MGHSWDWVEGLIDCSLIPVNRHTASDLRMSGKIQWFVVNFSTQDSTSFHGVCSIEPGAHNPVRATAILGLCNGIFTDQFIFSTIWQRFFLWKWKHYSVWVRTHRTIMTKKIKVNVFKTLEKLLSSLRFLPLGLQGLFDSQNSQKNLIYE